MWICSSPVCEEIQRRIRNIQHKVGKMSLIDPTRHKRKSTFFTATPTTSSESTASSPTDIATSPSSSSNAPTLNFNVKNPRKALLEKLLEPGDRLVQTVQVNNDLNFFFEKKFCLRSNFNLWSNQLFLIHFWRFFSLRVNGFVSYASFATDLNSVCWEPISTTTKKMNPRQSGLSSRWLHSSVNQLKFSS